VKKRGVDAIAFSVVPSTGAAPPQHYCVRYFTLRVTVRRQLVWRCVRVDERVLHARVSRLMSTLSERTPSVPGKNGMFVVDNEELQHLLKYHRKLVETLPVDVRDAIAARAMLWLMNDEETS